MSKPMSDSNLYATRIMATLATLKESKLDDPIILDAFLEHASAATFCSIAERELENHFGVVSNQLERFLNRQKDATYHEAKRLCQCALRALRPGDELSLNLVRFMTARLKPSHLIKIFSTLNSLGYVANAYEISYSIIETNEWAKVASTKSFAMFIRQQLSFNERATIGQVNSLVFNLLVIFNCR